MVPDTANVLAVSRLFGVSADYLLREECLRDDDIPAAKPTELSLQHRQQAMGEGILVRFLVFAAPAVWHLNRHDDGATLLVPFALCWALFAMLASVPFLQDTWQLLRKAWNLPDPPPKKSWKRR